MKIPFLLSAAISYGAACDGIAAGAASFETQGGEYALTASLRGDQVHPKADISSGRGFLVWEDNVSDEDGTGIGAMRLDGGLSGGGERFTVNADGAGDQGKPAVALLEGGGAVFVWESGNRIRARVLAANGVFTTPDDLDVSTHQGSPKVNPVVAGLVSGGSVVLWASYGQDDATGQEANGGYRHLQGVYGQRLDSTGRKVGGEFLVNQQVQFNQRNPAIARLGNGQLIAVWVSERGSISVSDGQLSDQIEGVEVMGRLLSESGECVGNEFPISARNELAATPSVAGTDDGFVVAWSQADRGSRMIGFEILHRAYDLQGLARGAAVRLNEYQTGDQYSPSVAAAGGSALVVWTSLGQDGSREGVYGRFTKAGGPLGEEFRVNSTAASQQLHPQAVSSGREGFLAIWTSFLGSPRDFEVLGQRYSTTLPSAPVPSVAALSSSRLMVAWPPAGGYDGLEYLVYMDGGSEPAVTKDIRWTTPGTLLPGSVHRFQLAFRLPNGAVSPLSDVGQGQTWGSDENFDGLPDDWQSQFWGSAVSEWPAPGIDSDKDGMSNRDEFLADTNPRDAKDVLRVSVTPTPSGVFVSWNTKAGNVYQLQESSVLGAWQNLGLGRFARSTSDKLSIEVPTGARYYRVIRLR